VNAGGTGRTPLVAGNWKMHKTVGAARAFVDELLPTLGSVDGVDIAVCPPFPGLGPVVEAVRGTRVRVYAQNMHQESEGAFTGEVAAPMLSDLGVDGVILGHSERRQMFGETDRALQAKVPAALGEGLVPILCVGETEEEREGGETERKLRHQVKEDLARIADEQLGEVVIAYEPIWAIGTGRVATVEQCQEAFGFIRALVADRSPAQAERVRLLYGGSVTPDNAGEIMSLPDVDGALVGGASLRADSFAAIASAAA
jgi:triosephosphate isomerase (TIM)